MSSPVSDSLLHDYEEMVQAGPSNRPTIPPFRENTPFRPDLGHDSDSDEDERAPTPPEPELPQDIFGPLSPPNFTPPPSPPLFLGDWEDVEPVPQVRRRIMGCAIPDEDGLVWESLGGTRRVYEPVRIESRVEVRPNGSQILIETFREGYYGDGYVMEDGRLIRRYYLDLGLGDTAPLYGGRSIENYGDQGRVSSMPRPNPCLEPLCTHRTPDARGVSSTSCTYWTPENDDPERRADEEW